MLYVTKDDINKDFAVLDYDKTEKENILYYFNQYEPCKFTSEPLFDVYTGEKIKAADNGYSDGKYTWYDSDIYHFEKYNMKLNEDFIDYVRKK